jgi:N-acetylneuraminic acid mutarotase
MVRYKMLARDVNSSPVQYRTWIVEDQPDFEAIQYTGLKSGSNPFVDVSAYIIYDDTAVVDFNLPNPLQWDTTKKVLPAALGDSQLAIIGEDIYLFGGKISGKIYKANINNPTDWVDTGAQLPTPLYGSQLLIINDIIYLIGGNDSSCTDHIFSASVLDPLTWTDHGSRLPDKIQNAQAIIVNSQIYLLGGKNMNEPQNTIFTASVSDPLTWANTGTTLPTALYGSQVAIIGDHIYLFGGLLLTNTPVENIYSAPLNDPTNWITANHLPYPICNGQFFAIGNKGYLITPGVVSTNPKSKGTRILRCDLSSPTQWVDTRKYVPGEVSESQVAIIYDRIFLFGGNGSSVIFANSSELKYKYSSTDVINYGTVTRTEVNNTPDKLDLFRVLGFPYWKTDYGA